VLIECNINGGIASCCYGKPKGLVRSHHRSGLPRNLGDLCWAFNDDLEDNYVGVVIISELKTVGFCGEICGWICGS